VYDDSVFVVGRQPASFTGVTHAFLDLAKFTPQVDYLSTRFVVECGLVV